jgi:BMFP domain-containing protein YqiC
VRFEGNGCAIHQQQACQRRPAACRGGERDANEGIAAATALALCEEGARGTNRVRHPVGAPANETSPENGMNERFLSELSARLAELAAANPALDLERNFRGLLASAFARLDLVTREEYDAQAQVLARAREKLAALEARITELESRLDKNAAG